jgi:hypothetical protein
MMQISEAVADKYSAQFAGDWLEKIEATGENSSPGPAKPRGIKSRNSTVKFGSNRPRHMPQLQGANITLRPNIADQYTRLPLCH